MKSKSLDELQAEAEEDMALREDRTDSDSAATPVIFNKYHNQLRLVTTELIRAQNVYKRLWFKKWYYYAGKAHPRVYEKDPLDHKVMRADLKLHIEADDEILKQTYIVEMLEMKKKFIEKKMQEINNRSHHIRNMVQTIKFKHGIN